MLSKEMTGVFPADIKSANREVVLSRYRDGAMHTPNEISAETGLSRMTVSKTIEFFLEQGILVKAEKGNSTNTGGRRPSNYILSGDLLFAVVQVEPWVIRLFLFNLFGEVLCRHEEPCTPHPSFAEVDSLVEKGAAVLMKAVPGESRVMGISVTIRGLVDIDRRLLRLSPFYPTWPRSQSFDGWLRYFPGADLLVLDKPVRTFARYILNRNRTELEDKRVLVLFYEHGFAGAMVTRGHIENGRNSIIGEFSFLDTDFNGQDPVGGRFHALRAAREVRDRFPESSLLRKDDLTLREILDAESAGDPAGLAAGDWLARCLARVLINVNLCYDADLTILCGELAHAGPLFLDTLRHEMAGLPLYPEGYLPEIRLEEADPGVMLLGGAMDRMLDFFYREPSLYRDPAGTEEREGTEQARTGNRKEG